VSELEIMCKAALVALFQVLIRRWRGGTVTNRCNIRH